MSGKPPTKSTDRQNFKKAQVRWADLQPRPGPPRLGDPGEPNSVLQAMSKATAEAAAAQPPPAQFLIALMIQAETRQKFRNRPSLVLVSSEDDA